MMPFLEIACDDLDHINQEIISWYTQQPQLIHSKIFWNSVDHKDLLEHCHRFDAWCEQAGMHIRHIAMTIGRDPECCPPHVDTPMSKVFSRWKLSWPVLNYRDTYNCWYEHTTADPIFHTMVSGGRRYPNRDQLREIYRREVASPSLIDPSTPHDVVFGSCAVYPRLVLQCMLLQDPDNL